MKKKYIVGIVALVAVASLAWVGARALAAEEKQGEKPVEKPAVWNPENVQESLIHLRKNLNGAYELIVQLRNQVNELWRRIERVKQGPRGERGPAGPVGPQGVQGSPTTRGAGNIAFTFRDAGDDIHVLKTDGTVWKWPLLGWAPEGVSGINAPIPVSDIVDWQVISFLDKNGDVWRFSFASSTWGNYGHP